MHKITHWLTNLANEVLGSFLAQILLTIAFALAAAIYAFYTTNPQAVLLVVLIILTTINTLTSLALLTRQASITNSLQELLPLTELFPSRKTDYDPIARQAEKEFAITDKHFDESAKPQKLVVRFTNRGNDVIRVQKVKYSETGLGLPATALLTEYRIEAGGRYTIIPFDARKSEVLPGQNFLVELYLAQKWEPNIINRYAGQWGYLKPEVLYHGKSIELFYSI